jgi:hypothetical protein
VYSHNIFSTLKDESNLDKLSFKMMTTEDNKLCNDATFQEGSKFDEEILEEGNLGNGMRKRGDKHPSALSVTDKPLSRTSKMYDVDGDGKLDEAEQAMREMDTENRGFLTNEKVYKILLEQMKLQQEVFGLKRMSIALVFVVFLLSLATLGTSFAAATLAKDTSVVNGNLVAKDGSGVLGTSNVAATFIVEEGAGPPGGEERRLQNTYVDDSTQKIWISRIDADDVWGKCDNGGTVHLKRSCQGGTVLIDVPICSGASSLVTSTWSSGPLHTLQTISGAISTISCYTSVTYPCEVQFPAGTPACPNPSPMNPVDLSNVGDYVILAKTGISTVPDSVITGDIAVSPIVAAAITGFNLAMDVGLEFSTDGNDQIRGNAYASNYGGATPATLTTAVNAMQTAYTDAAGRPNSDGARINLNGGYLNGHVLTPGVYTFSTAVGLTGDIHFQGSPTDVFIIQIASNLIQDAGYRVILDTTWVGTPSAKNIFWQVAGGVKVNAGAHMEGIILGFTSVTFITGSSLNGRILAQTAVALQKATITNRL